MIKRKMRSFVAYVLSFAMLISLIPGSLAFAIGREEEKEGEEISLGYGDGVNDIKDLFTKTGEVGKEHDGVLYLLGEVTLKLNIGGLGYDNDTWSEMYNGIEVVKDVGSEGAEDWQVVETLVINGDSYTFGEGKYLVRVVENPAFDWDSAESVEDSVYKFSDGREIYRIEKEMSLSELLGGGADSEVKVDDKDPGVDVVYAGGYDVAQETWVSSGDLEVEALEGGSALASVNISGVEYEINKVDDDWYVCAEKFVNNLPDGKNTVRVIVRSVSGREFEDVYVVLKDDGKDPVLRIVGVDPEYVVVDENNDIIKKGTVVTVYADPGVTGVKKLMLVTDDGEKELDYTIVDGGTALEEFTYVIEEEGMQTITLENGAGRLDKQNLVGPGGELDAEAPKLEIQTPYGEEWYRKNLEELKFKATDDVQVGRASVEVDGEEVTEISAEGDEYTAKVNLGEGKHHVKVSVKDLFGEEVVEEFDYNVDLTAPKLGAVGCGGLSSSRDKWYAGESIEVAAAFEDSTSGVKEILFDGQSFNGKVELFEVNTEKKFTVTDNAGNVFETTLGKVLEEYGVDDTKIVFDTKVPVVKLEVVDDNFFMWNGYKVYAGGVDVSMVVEDENLDTAEVTINGVKKSILADSAKIEDTLRAEKQGVNSIVVVAKDRTGNEVTSSLEFYVDNEEPSLSPDSYVKFEGVGNGLDNAIVDDTLWTTGNVVLHLYPMDGVGFSAGLKKLRVYSGDNDIAVFDNPVSGEEYVVTLEADNYSGQKLRVTVEIEDNAGEISRVILPELVGESFNELGFDLKQPVVQVEKEDGYIDAEGKQWYVTLPELKVSVFEADSGIAKFVVNVNGFEIPATLTDGTVVLTQDALANVIESNGKNTFYFKAIDNVGRSSEESFDLWLDSNAPSLMGLDAEIEGNHQNHDNVVFIGGILRIKGTVKDNGVGIESVILTDAMDNKVVDLSENVNYEFNTSGEYARYRIVSTDKLGNESSESVLNLVKYALGDEYLVSVIIDRSAPVISYKLPEETTQVNGYKWYNGNVVFGFEVEDTDLFEVYVNDKLVEEPYEITSNVAIGQSEKKTYVIKAVDKAGNESSETIEFGVDMEKPSVGTLEAVIDNNYLFDGTLYVDKNITINGYPEDTGSGLKSVKLYEDATSGVDFESGYTTKEDGDVSDIRIEAFDNVGNKLSIDMVKLIHRLGGMDGVEKVVVDTTAPEVKFGAVNGYWFKDNQKLSFTVTDENLMEVSVKGIDALEKEGDNYSFETSVEVGQAKELKYTAIAKDKAGNEAQDTVELGIDRSAPTAGSIGVRLTGETSLVGNILYITGGAKIEGTPEDTGSGVKIVKLFDPNGELLQGNARLVQYTIEKDGNISGYSVKVEDGVGNSLSLDLLWLVRDLKPEYAGVTKVILDNEMPTVSIQKPEPADYIANDGMSWFKDNVEFVVSVTDSNISEFYVNGELVELSDDGEYTVKTSVGAESAKVLEYKFKAVDNAGNTKEEEYKLGIDRKTPGTGSIKVNTTLINNTDEGLFVTNLGKISLSGAASDEGSGVKKVTLLKSGETGELEEVASWNETAGYTWTRDSEGGEFFIQVEDNVGNLSEAYSLQEIANGAGSQWKTNLIVITNGSTLKITGPEVDLTGKNDDNGNLWFPDDPKLKYTVTGKYLDTIKVSVNDQVVDVDIEKSGDTYTFSVKKNSDGTGKFVVKVEAENLGWYTKETEYKYGVDRTKPEDEVKLISGGNEITLTDDTIYLSGAVRFSGSVKDSDVGMGYYTVLKNGEVWYTASDVTNVDFTVNSSGEYTVKYADRLESSNTTVNTGIRKYISGAKTNKVIFDNTKPEVTLVSTSEFKTSGGINWTRVDPNFSVKVHDANLKSVEFFLNGEPLEETSIVGEVYNLSPVTEDGQWVLTCKAVDIAGNTTEIELYRYCKDATAPVLSGASAGTPVSQKGGKVYFHEPFEVILEGDDGSGIGGEVYYVNDKAISGKTFKVGGNGEYSVYSVDLLGNKSKVKTLQELCGWQGNYVVIDNSKPTVTVTYPEGKNGWYSEDQFVSIVVEDDQGLESIKVTVNGQTVIEEYIKATDVTSRKYEWKTDKEIENADGSFSVSVEAIDNAKNVSDSNGPDTLKIDRQDPYVADFILTGVVNSSGKTVKGSDGVYSFFFNGDNGGTVEVKVNDNDPSSGIKSIWTKLGDGEWVKHDTSEKSFIVAVPKDFKGTVYAKVVDGVDRESAIEQPDGMVSETSNTHINSSSIDISLPETQYRDASGTPLYSTNINPVVTVKSDWAGIKEVQWGVNDGTSETITSFEGSIKSTDKNLVTGYSKSVSVGDSANSVRVWVKVIDNAGHSSDNYKVVSIDKDAPVLSVSYDTSSEDRFFNVNRVATITVRERNFDPSLVEISGVYGNVGSWRQDGEVWTNTISFTEDKDYAFSIVVTDRAGNVSEKYNSPEFTVDKTAPEMSVSWDNNDVRNEKYYSAGRTATVVVREHNFDPSKIVLTGNGNLSGWSSNGDVHTATVSCVEDGTFSFTLTGTDRARNPVQEFSSGEFIVDKVNPEISVTGVTSGVSYKENVGLFVDIKDSYIDTGKTTVTLSGKNHPNVIIVGNLNATTGHYEFSNFEREASVDDVYTLTVHVEDLAGNVSEESVTFSVNRFGSTYRFASEGIVGEILREPKDIIIQEVNVDRIDTDAIQVVVYKDGKEIKVDKNWVTATETEVDGKYLYEYRINKECFKEDGKYSVQIYSVSADGTKYTSAVEVYEFVVDGTAPSVLVSGVKDNGRYKDYSRTVTVEVHDLTGVASINVMLNGKKIDVVERNGVYVFTIQESSETQDLVVTVVDWAGNTSEVQVKNFLVTSNPWAFILNQWWFWLIIAIVALTFLWLLLILLKRRKKERDEELENAKISEELYRSSGSSSGSGSSSSGGISSGETEPMTGGLSGADTASIESPVSEDDIGTKPLD